MTEHIEQTIRICTFQFYCQHMTETVGEFNNYDLLALDLDFNINMSYMVLW